MTTEYRGHVIVVKEVTRDWSEDAYVFTVPSLGISDEGEGLERCIGYAEADIDKRLNDYFSE